eukprot:GDKJ01037655.1.p1 GENE.GDKJ01037655.1~~GDKJ01037655.1.p1  ORF type:complete len:815 (-),score=193.65 GDKJ01037655.1:317-2761(-)
MSIVSQFEGTVSLVLTKVKKNVSENQVIATIKGNDGKSYEIRSPVAGTLEDFSVSKNDHVVIGQEIGMVKLCSHAVLMRDICVSCGFSVKQSDSVFAGFMSTDQSFKISKEYAKEKEDHLAQKYMQEKKLVLVLDFDNTLAHCSEVRPPANPSFTQFSPVYPTQSIFNCEKLLGIHLLESIYESKLTKEQLKTLNMEEPSNYHEIPLYGSPDLFSKRSEMRKMSRLEAQTLDHPLFESQEDLSDWTITENRRNHLRKILEGSTHTLLFPEIDINSNPVPSVPLFLKFRPGLYHFLSSLKSKYELWIFTHGTQDYIISALKVVDPLGLYFPPSTRVLSRHHSKFHSEGRKSLSLLFPSLSHLCAIVDDRSDVWGEEEQALVRCSDYLFLPRYLKPEIKDFYLGKNKRSATEVIYGWEGGWDRYLRKLGPSVCRKIKEVCEEIRGRQATSGEKEETECSLEGCGVKRKSEGEKGEEEVEVKRVRLVNEEEKEEKKENLPEETEGEIAGSVPCFICPDEEVLATIEDEDEDEEKNEISTANQVDDRISWGVGAALLTYDREDDRQLFRLVRLLNGVHDHFFTFPVSVSESISAILKGILEGVNFTSYGYWMVGEAAGVTKDNAAEKCVLFRLAQRLGAVYTSDFDEDLTTHYLTTYPVEGELKKIEEANKYRSKMDKIKVVSMSWLRRAVFSFAKGNEDHYPAPTEVDPFYLKNMKEEVITPETAMSSTFTMPLAGDIQFSPTARGGFEMSTAFWERSAENDECYWEKVDWKKQSESKEEQTRREGDNSELKSTENSEDLENVLDDMFNDLESSRKD